MNLPDSGQKEMRDRALHKPDRDRDTHKPKNTDRFLTKGQSGTMRYFPHESVTQWDTKRKKYVDDDNRCAQCDHRLSGDEYGICKGCFEKATNGVPVAPRDE